jgi:hypothetical protein
MPDQKVDTAADLEAAKAKLAEAQAAHDVSVKEKLANKSPAEITTDLLDAIVMRLGNRPDMRAMVAALKPKPEKEEPPSTK